MRRLLTAAAMHACIHIYMIWLSVTILACSDQRLHRPRAFLSPPAHYQVARRDGILRREAISLGPLPFVTRPLQRMSENVRVPSTHTQYIHIDDFC